jgi:hypothetical protein
MVIAFTTDGPYPPEPRLILACIVGIKIDVQARYSAISKLEDVAETAARSFAPLSIDNLICPGDRFPSADVRLIVGAQHMQESRRKKQTRDDQLMAGWAMPSSRGGEGSAADIQACAAIRRQSFSRTLTSSMPAREKVSHSLSSRFRFISTA